MGKTLAIAWLGVRRDLQNRFTLFFFLILPLGMTALLGLMYGGGRPEAGPVYAARAAVADLDGSDLSARLAAALRDQSEVAVDAAPGAAEAREGVRSGRWDGAVIIPPGFGAALATGQEATVELAFLPQNNRSSAVMHLADAAAARVGAGLAAAERAAGALAGAGLDPAREQAVRERAYAAAEQVGSAEPPAVTVAAAPAVAPGPRSGTGRTGFSQSSLGFTVTFVMWGLLAGAGALMDERRTGTWARLLAAPVHRWEILLGKLLGIGCFSVLQVALMVAFGQWVLGVDYGSAPLALALVFGSLIWAGLGIGLLIATLVRTQGQLGAIAPLLANAGAMIGGCYWPLEFVPRGMQLAAWLTPHGWGMDALSDIVMRGAGLGEVWPAIAVLGFMGLAALAAALPRVRFE